MFNLRRRVDLTLYLEAMNQNTDLVEALSAEIEKLCCPSKPIRLKASEKVVVELFNTRLVGKLLADRSVNKNVVRAIILKAWRNSRGVKIIDLKENIFLFKFASEGDRRRILELGPWNIKGYPLILKQWNQNQTAEDVDFSSLHIWVQIHGLPIEYMSKENAKEIGALVGKVVEVDFTGDGKVCISQFLRVKVEFEVAKPLKSGFYLDRSPLLELWVRFKYERIADFCYKCERLGHLKAKCIYMGANSKKALMHDPFGYGPWLKADPLTKRASRWVEFISKDDQKTEERSAEIQKAEGPRMVTCEFHANESPRSEESSDKVGPLVEVSRNLPTDFQNLSEHITSNKISLDKFHNLPSQSQPKVLSSHKNQTPLNQVLKVTAINTITLMEMEPNHNQYPQDSTNPLTTEYPKEKNSYPCYQNPTVSL